MANTEAETPKFSEASKALDEILEKFKSGNLSLEESIQLFETGVSQLKICQTGLTQSRGKVEVLIKSLQKDGEIVTEPFEA